MQPGDDDDHDHDNDDHDHDDDGDSDDGLRLAPGGHRLPVRLILHGSHSLWSPAGRLPRRECTRAGGTRSESGEGSARQKLFHVPAHRLPNTVAGVCADAKHSFRSSCLVSPMDYFSTPVSVLTNTCVVHHECLMH